MTVECAYAKSDMTPCVIKDGHLAVGFDHADRRLCVGCDRSVERIYQALGKTPPREVLAVKPDRKP